MPPEAGEVIFCDRHGLTWAEYDRMPLDRQAVWSYVDAQLDAARRAMAATAGSTHPASAAMLTLPEDE